jgi:flagellar biosynthesis/type III secretory pathway protein FliH
MKELSLSFGHFKREDELPLTIIVNGCTYQSQPLVDATKKTYFEMGKKHGMELGSDNTYSDNEMSSMHDAWYDNGYTKGYEAGYDAGIDHGIEKTLQEDRVKEELERTKQTWYAKGTKDGYEAGMDEGYKSGYANGLDNGKQEGYDEGYKKGYDAGKSEYSVKLEERLKSRYISVHIDGYEQCKHDGISKINLNTESVEQTELSKEYDKELILFYVIN